MHYSHEEDIMKNKVIILVGIPGSGKTTWAKKFIADNPNYVRVSRDDFRYMLRNCGFCIGKIENMITELVENATIKALCKNLNVILDATHVKMEFITAAIRAFNEYADIEFKVFDIDAETCILRDEVREKKVGADVIRGMDNNFRNLKSIFDFEPIGGVRRSAFNPVSHPELPKAVLFDIDGTLAIMGDRSPYDWNRVGVDSCCTRVAELVDFHCSKGRRIIVMSGRDGSAESETRKWLVSNNIVFDTLLMRNAGDMRKDSVVKKEMYEEHIKGIYDVWCVYDDRLQVVKMWYEQGIFVFNVNQGMKEF